jgi:imidazolonepropionase-like amidohydrolase
MKSSFIRLLLVVFPGLFAIDTAHGGQITVFTGARLIDGTGGAPTENATVVIEDDRIVTAGAAGKDDRHPANAKFVDCHGYTIIPGLISDHSHLGLVKDGKVSPENYTEENIGRQLRLYEGYGVTAVLSLGVNKDLLYALRDQQRAGGIGGADIFTADHGLGVVSAAPPLPVGPDQIVRPGTPDEARQMVDEMAARHPDLLKIWVDDFFGSVKPRMSPEIQEAIISEAHRQGLRVAAHVFYLEDAKRLLQEGLDVIAHSVRDQAVDQEFIDLMKQRRAAYIATLTLDEAQFIYAEHPAWMQTAAFQRAANPKLLETWLSPQYAAKMRQNPQTPMNQAALTNAMHNVKTVFDAGVLVGFGTDSGASPTRLPGWAEHRELQLLVAAGLTPGQAIACATSHAAQLLGDQKNRGTVEAGKRADFLILAGNPLEDIANTTRLVAVYHGGRRVEPAFADRAP